MAALSADARMSRPPSIPPLLWALALLALSRWPAAVAVLPVLGVLRGPLALVLVALAVAASVFRAGHREPARLRDPGPRVLLAVAFAGYALLGLYYTGRLRVSGDEPHYLLMAQSLWRDGDLDLRDNYAREDWREYTPGPVSPHYGAPRADGRPYPAHSPGLPALLAPAYALAGRAGCVLVLAAFAAALTLEVHRLARRFGGEESPALAWALAAGPPLAAYAFHVYTEVPAAWALAASLRLVLDRPRPAAAAGAALLAGFLPWLHLKMIPAAAALGAISLLRLEGPSRMAFAATAAALAALFAGYYFAVFGQVSPLAIYGGVPADLSGSPLRASAGLLLDRSFGLLPHAPAYLLALAGIGALAARGGSAGLAHGVVGAAVLLPVLGWRMWWGGQCPPARFLVPAIPFLAAATAARAAEPVRGLLRWRAPLALLGIGLVALASADPGRLLFLNRGARPTRLWAALSGEVAVGRYLPSLTLPDPEETRVALVWAAALAVLLALDALARRRDRVDGWFRGLAIPCLMLLAVGALVDGWARPGAAPEPPPGLSASPDPGPEG
jgi:hypothetical protein